MDEWRNGHMVCPKCGREMMKFNNDAWWLCATWEGGCDEVVIRNKEVFDCPLSSNSDED